MSEELFLLSDEKLVESVKNKSKEAFDEIVRRYSKFLNYMTRLYYIKGASAEDVRQEALIGLYKAALTYDANSKLSFTGFAFMSIKCNVKRAVSIGNRQKNKPLGDYISIYGEDFTEYEQMSSLQSVAETPEAYVIKQTMIHDVTQVINDNLSEKEKDVLLKFVNGNSYRAIAKNDGVDLKSVDNALNRARNKLSENIDIDDYLSEISKY